MSAAVLLERLDGVRQRSNGQWLAQCPSHDDKSPSLSMREVDNGTVLLRCFAGCTAYEIVTAAGLELRDLFPPRGPDQRQRRQRHHLSARDVVDVLEHEFLLVLVVASDLRKGLTPLPEDFERLAVARDRVQRIKEAVA